MPRPELRPLTCPECGSARHRLHYVTRTRPTAFVDGKAAAVEIDEAYACRDCGLRGPWRLASVDVLVAAHKIPAPEGSSSTAPAVVPSQAESRAEIRALFADLQEESTA